MSVSLWILSALIILIMFGAGQRILDQMRLNDKQAIIVLLAIVVGILIPPIYVTKYFCFSIGGFLIPFIICLYMLFSAGWSRDLLRAVIGTILVAGIIYGLEWLMPSESAEDIVIDPMYVYGVVAGVVAYMLGRSRRNAFVSCVLGVSLAMLIQFIVNMAMGTPTVLGLGVGGAFGTIIISTTISVALCEFLGRAFETAKKDEGAKVFNYETHTYDSVKNGRLNQDGSKAMVVENDKGELLTTSDAASQKSTKSAAKPQKMGTYVRHNTAKNTKKSKKSIKTSAFILAFIAMFSYALLSPSHANIDGVQLPKAVAEESQSATNSYFTIYDYQDKEKVIFVKGDGINVGDEYLSADNKLYEIVSVDNKAKMGYAEFVCDENLPKFNVRRKELASNQAAAESLKKVGVYHTHNDECYIDADGTDSIYGAGGIHDVGQRFVDNMEKLGVTVVYKEDLHLPHNSGAYTRSQVTASAILDTGNIDALFDLHRDSTPRSEYLTTVNGKEMSKVRMVVGSANANYYENKEFAYAIKAYADEVYPNFIKDIYMGKGNYNQQLTSRGMLFEMGCENIEKEYALRATEPLTKVLDVVLYGSSGASEESTSEVEFVDSTGQKSVITGIAYKQSTASVSFIWILLGGIGFYFLVLGIVCIFSKTARHKTARFFKELVAIKK